MAITLFESPDQRLTLNRFYGGTENGTCYQVTWHMKFWQFYNLDDAKDVYNALLIAHWNIKTRAFKEG